MSLWLISEWGALALDVIESIGIVLEKWRELFEASLMELVEVVDLIRRKELLVNQVSTVGCRCEVVPAEVILDGWVFLAHLDVFDSDTELSTLIVSWLV